MRRWRGARQPAAAVAVVRLRYEEIDRRDMTVGSWSCQWLLKLGCSAARKSASTRRSSNGQRWEPFIGCLRAGPVSGQRCTRTCGMPHSHGCTR